MPVRGLAGEPGVGGTRYLSSVPQDGIAQSYLRRVDVESGNGILVSFCFLAERIYELLRSCTEIDQVDQRSLADHLLADHDKLMAHVLELSLPEAFEQRQWRIGRRKVAFRGHYRKCGLVGVGRKVEVGISSNRDRGCDGVGPCAPAFFSPSQRASLASSYVHHTEETDVLRSSELCSYRLLRGSYSLAAHQGSESRLQRAARLQDWARSTHSLFQVNRSSVKNLKRSKVSADHVIKLR